MPPENNLIPKISACTLDCQDSCSTIVMQNKDGSVSIAGNPDHPFTRGFICSKGKKAWQRLKSAERILTPLVRQGSGFTPSSWEDALDLVAEKISALRDTPESILHIRHYGFRGVLSDAGKYLFNALGAATTRGALCDEAGIAACMADFGALEMNDPGELMKAGVLVNWGKDFFRCSVHLTQMVKYLRKQGKTIITISPGGDNNASLSDQVISIKPGTDRFLASAVIKVLLDGNLVSSHVLSRAVGIDSLKTQLNRHSLTSLLWACGCSYKDLNILVDAYTRNGKGATATIVGWGLQRYIFGGETVRFINALAFLSGNIGITGGGTYFNISSGRNINSKWVNRPGRPSRTFLFPDIGREILRADPPVRFLLTDGGNFVNQAPNAAQNIKAMEKISFKVAVDAFMTDTAMRSDVILPCALNYEREEILGSCLHNFVNYASCVFSPPGEARADFHIMEALAGRLGIPFPEKDDIIRDALIPEFFSETRADKNQGQVYRHNGQFDIIDNLIPKKLVCNTDTNDPWLTTLKKKGFIKADHPDVAWKDLRFAHGDGKYRLPRMLSPEPEPPAGYPLHLLSLINRHYMHSQIPEALQKGLPKLWINPESPGLDNIDRASLIFLSTSLGRMAVELHYLDDLHPMAVIIRRGGWIKHGNSVNPLIEPRITDIGETAAYYSQYARLEN